MGLLDALFGRRKLPPSKIDQLGAVAGAELTLRTEMGAVAKECVGIAVRGVAASHFERVRHDLEQMLRLAGRDLGSHTTVQTDEFSYVWVLVKDEDFPDLVAAAQVTAQTMKEEGFGDQLLCAVFPFAVERAGTLYLIYSFKRGVFYAFAPKGDKSRDLALELRTHALLDRELPLEKELEYRYPMWGMPL